MPPHHNNHLQNPLERFTQTHSHSVQISAEFADCWWWKCSSSSSSRESSFTANTNNAALSRLYYGTVCRLECCFQRGDTQNHHSFFHTARRVGDGKKEEQILFWSKRVNITVRENEIESVTIECECVNEAYNKSFWWIYMFSCSIFISVAVNRRRFVYLCVCLDTGITSKFISWRCKVDGNLFCMSAADSSLGRDSSFIGLPWQAGVIHGRQVNLLLIWPDRAEKRRLTAGPHAAWGFRVWPAQHPRPASSFVTQRTSTGRD